MRLFPGILALTLAAGFTARAELATGIKAVVHDSVITYLDVENLTQQTADVLRRQYSREPEEFQKRINAARQENLDKLTDRELILHEFKTAGYQLPDSVIDEIVKNRLRAFFPDRRTATKTLQARGMTYEQFRTQERDRYIIEAMRSKNISQELIVSPSKIVKYYQDHAKDFKVEDEVKLRTIVLNKGSDAEKARRMAEEIMGKLREGVPFAEMASTYSQGSDKAQGGARPWQEIKDLRRELADTVRPLKAGQYSDLIDTPESVWIVQVEDKREAYTRPLVEVRDQIERDLITAERARLEQQWIAKLKKKTFVRYF